MSQATDMLAAYILAEQQALIAVTVEGANRKVQMAQLEDIRKGRAEWQRAVNAETAAAAGAPTIGGMAFSQASFGP
jgi:hypothetical protein